MKKEILLKELKKLKKGILSFQEDRKMKIINIPSDKVVIDEKYYKKHDLENNKKLKSALHHQAYRIASDKIKKKVYNYKSGLKKDYGKLELYIKKIGLNPVINNFSCYDAFFLNDSWNNEDINYKSIISDIDIIIGKVESLDNKGISAIIRGNNKNYWKIYNPIYWLLLLIDLGKKHILISFIVFLLLIIIKVVITDSIKPLTEKFSIPLSNFLSGSLNNND